MLNKYVLTAWIPFKPLLINELHMWVRIEVCNDDFVNLFLPATNECIFGFAFTIFYAKKGVRKILDTGRIQGQFVDRTIVPKNWGDSDIVWLTATVWNMWHLPAKSSNLDPLIIKFKRSVFTITTQFDSKHLHAHNRTWKRLGIFLLIIARAIVFTCRLNVRINWVVHKAFH